MDLKTIPMQGKQFERPRVMMLAVLLLGAAIQAGAAEMSVNMTQTPPGPVNRGDTIQYTVTITNTTAPAATLNAVNFTNNLDPNVTLVAGSLRVSPVAVDDAYTATGNVSISVP